MNNRMNNRSMLLGIIGALWTVALAGCGNPLLPNPSAGLSGTAGTVLVLIEMPESAAGKNAARTLYPSLEGFTRYELSFSGPRTRAPETVSPGESRAFELMAGNWTITATAYSSVEETETPAARGSAQVTVSEGVIAEANITLSPYVGGGTGVLSYHISVPEGASGALVITTADGASVAGGSVPLSSEAESTLTLDAGQYLLSILLTKGDEHAGVIEALHIYPGMTTAASYAFTPDDFAGFVSLSHNAWAEGNITAEGEAQWYQFTAEEGVDYQVMWNTQGYGDGTKTLYAAYISAFKSDGSALFQNTYDGWNYPNTISGATGTVYLKVQAAWGNNYTGTYAVKFYNPAILPPQVAARITWVSANPAPACVVQWNYVYDITGYHLYRSTSPDSGYTPIAELAPDSTTYTDTAVSKGATYYYRVAAYNGNGEGEKSPAVSDTVPTATPELLANNIWAEANISAEGEAHWYRFTAVAGTDYQVMWNDGYSGDGTKTLYAAYVSAFKSDGSALFQNYVDGWNYPQTISGVTGTVYLKVQEAWNNNNGSYAVKFYNPAILPPQVAARINWVSANPAPACAVSWNYVYDITGYHLYRSTSPDSGYAQIADLTDTTYTDTAVSKGTAYYYQVAAYNGNGEGEKSPAVSDTVPTATPELLAHNTWAEANISAEGEAHWYRFTAVEGTDYQVTSNTQSSGDGTKTLPYASVSAFKSDGSVLFQDAVDAWNAQTISGVSGTVYLKIKSYYEGYTGSYAVKFIDQSVTIPAAVPDNLSLAQSLAWIQTNAAAGSEYTITLRADETISPTALSYNGKFIRIILQGDSAERTVSLGSTGSLFAVGSGVTLTLDNNVTLQGRSDNTASLVQVSSGGALAMQGNAKITGNTTTSYEGGGVYVYNGSFTMSDNATVSGNTTFYNGGGVFVYNYSSFTMSDSATVSGNTASNTGGGVYVYYYSSFTMSDSATVSGNTASYGGGGVFVSGVSSFTKTGGVIYGSNETDPALRNIVKDSAGEEQIYQGAAIYTDSAHRRETTVGAEQDMSYDGNGGTFTGEWNDAVPVPSFNMVYVSGGVTFPTGYYDEGTATVAGAYEIGETQVTYELWYAVKVWAESHGYTFYNNPGCEGSHGSWNTTPGANKQEPVTGVSWFDAVVWLNALTEWYNATNPESAPLTAVYYYDSLYAGVAKNSDYNSNFVKEDGGYTYASAYAKPGTTGFRLPTSNEWELAARWRNDSANTVSGYTNPWFTKGDSASGATANYDDAAATNAVGWYWESTDFPGGTQKTQPVKGKAANSLGLYDMSGNVWEWSDDWYPSYTGSSRIIRGGSWDDYADYLRVGGVDVNDPDVRFNVSGFRPARTAN